MFSSFRYPHALLMFTSFFVALAATVIISGCGDDSGDDPVPGLCAKQCELAATDSCFSKRGDCIAGCEQVGYATYKTGFKPAACAQCFIEKIAYSKDPADNTKCWGVVLDGKNLAGADMNLPACQPACKDPYDP
ncbi:MAG: hypothetical protein KAI47_01195 [Deltaproteobacteria bacterium]|nr:hypothetical protein [Deltaproteobacteria bacterium]